MRHGLTGSTVAIVKALGPMPRRAEFGIARTGREGNQPLQSATEAAALP